MAFVETLDPDNWHFAEINGDPVWIYNSGRFVHNYWIGSSSEPWSVSLFPANENAETAPHHPTDTENSGWPDYEQLTISRPVAPLDPFWADRLEYDIGAIRIHGTAGCSAYFGTDQQIEGYTYNSVTGLYHYTIQIEDYGAYTWLDSTPEERTRVIEGVYTPVKYLYNLRFWVQGTVYVGYDEYVDRIELEMAPSNFWVQRNRTIEVI